MLMGGCFMFLSQPKVKKNLWTLGKKHISSAILKTLSAKLDLPFFDSYKIKPTKFPYTKMT